MKDGEGNPVPGAIILLDDVNQKRLTDAAGYFKIKLDKAPKIIAASSQALGIKKVAYKNNDNIIINIIPNLDTSEIVVKDLNYKDDNTIQFRNIYDYLRGKVSGVYITANNGITIRGDKPGNNSPMFILNDNQVDEATFANIVPTTIKSIQVYKGTETSIFGARGVNGVIKVTTL